MLLAMKGSVCWSPSTAPAPRTVLAVLRRTGRGDERVRHLPAREGMPQLHGEDRLERADGSEAQEPADGGESSPLPPRRRCSAIAHDLRTSHGRVLQIKSWTKPFVWTLARWPQISGEIGGGPAARFAVRGALSSSARSQGFVRLSFTPLVELPSRMPQRREASSRPTGDNGGCNGDQTLNY